MNPTLPPRRSLLLCTGSGDRRRGKVYERLAHKNSDTPPKKGDRGDFAPSGCPIQATPNREMKPTRFAQTCFISYPI